MFIQPCRSFEQSLNNETEEKQATTTFEQVQIDNVPVNDKTNSASSISSSIIGSESEEIVIPTQQPDAP